MTRLAELRERWLQLQARERRLILWAAGLIGVAVFWWVALQPALRTLAQAPHERARVQAQGDAMRAMQTEAQALREQAPLQWVDVEHRVSEIVAKSFGPAATIRWDGGNATVTLQNAPATALANWLPRVRAETGVRIQACHLRRASPQAWSGEVLLHVPRP